MKLVLLSTLAAAAVAQSAGAFIATGSMITPRAEHRATLLTNGKVFITGGLGLTGFSPPLSTAELYDPSSRAFIRTGDLSTARAGHTSTLLPDGGVLIAGGANNLSAETYDPATGIFTATRDMVAHPYSWLESTTLLQDGRVFIAGQPAAQLYDPVTGTFAATGSYAAPAPTFMERATLLADGRVLLTGGSDTAGWSEVYDPARDTFSLTGVMNFWDNVNTATLLPSGKVLFVGDEGYGFLADAEIFDPSDGTFTRIGNASASHEYATSTLLPDGTVLITGGQMPGGNGQVVSEVYAPVNSAFSAAANMITGRHEHTATLLTDGTVLIAGGYSGWPSSTSSAELYHPAVLVPAPVLFSLWHAATGQAASGHLPAVAGEALSMYTTSLSDGSVIPPQVALGGRLAEILFFGNAPGYPGLNQVNVRVPGGIAPGSDVPVRLTYLGRSSNEVTIAVQ